MASASFEVLLDAAGIARTLERLARELCASLPAGVAVGLVGIRSRGEVLAERLEPILRNLGVQNIETGALDITLYRDDLPALGPTALVRATEIEFDINGRYLGLVDDVLYTGRSIRAAMDALIDLGRPRQIQLAILIDRGHRELPIRADYVGKNIPSARAEEIQVKLTETDGVDEVAILSPEAAR